jgi:ATP-dependent protease Clp ATPase subunit
MKKCIIYFVINLEKIMTDELITKLNKKLEETNRLAKKMEKELPKDKEFMEFLDNFLNFNK